MACVELPERLSPFVARAIHGHLSIPFPELSTSADSNCEKNVELLKFLESLSIDKHVCILAKDEQKLLNKLKEFREDSASVRVITDFDYTLTCLYTKERRCAVQDSGCVVGKNRCASCHKVIEDCGLLGPQYDHDARSLQLHYYPIEIDPHMPADEKAQHMADWVTKAHQLLLSHGLSTDVIEKAVDNAIKAKSIVLRDCVEDFFLFAKQHGVPLLIFSAGLQDVMIEVLRRSLNHHDVLDYINVISNKCQFSDEGVVEAFNNPLIHVFNKRSSHFSEHNYIQECNENFSRIILIGDSIGDVHMSEGLKAHGTERVLSVGFLSDLVDERMDQYLDAFDVVILGDNSFDPALKVLKYVVNGI